MIEVEYQKALYARLSGASIGAPIYDTAPQSSNGASTGPYVAFGWTSAGEFDDWGVNGLSILTRIHTWSRTGSMLECKTIQGRIYAALHNTPLIISGALNTLVLREDSTCFADQDGKIHGVCEYRALVESA